VVTDNFCTWLGDTTLVQDDALFNAALVGFGSFGLIHGLLIETEPVYLLERFVKHYHFEEVEQALYTLNMSGLGLPKGDMLPFHFEAVLNPYGNKHGKSAFVRVFYKEAFQTPKKTSEFVDYPKRVNDVIEGMGIHFDNATIDLAVDDSTAGTAVGHAAVGVAANESTAKIGDTGWFLQVALNSSFPQTAPGLLEFSFPGDQFHGSTSTNEYSPYPLSTASIEMGFPLNRVKDAVKLIVEVTNVNRFPTPLALRYVKSSSAMLAFTRYAPITVTMEMPGIDYGPSRKGYQAIFNALALSGIPHTYHWGQGLPLNSDWVSKSYGADTIKSWKRLRLELLGAQGSRIFSNGLLETIGLLN